MGWSFVLPQIGCHFSRCRHLTASVRCNPDSGGVLPLGQTSVAPGKGGGPSFIASQAQNWPLLPASAVPVRDFLRVGHSGSLWPCRAGIAECRARGHRKAPEGRLGEEPIQRPMTVVEFPADWRRYRKGAGPVRNQQMPDEGKATEALANSCDPLPHTAVPKSSGYLSVARPETFRPWQKGGLKSAPPIAY
jgi:hypothetical protein